MPKGCVLLDTSFFIRLLKEDDRLHQNTVEYFKYFLENDYTLKVSTIAIVASAALSDFKHVASIYKPLRVKALKLNLL